MGYSTSDSKVAVFVPSAELLGEPGLEIVVAALDSQIAATNARHRETVLPVEVKAWNERVQDERDRRSLERQVKARLRAYNEAQE
ncbi:hypothetical protein CH260_12745 [Rhodococcus sp. 05-2256-B2]|nr:hypothetical protein CH258_18250 [Rhodococcus sp. 05-2256-B4]OZD96179.1 hypothetical protein CH260_12745 [Rhodococcus sp. 05-2256-B2]OZD96601.1 hypothetical protein CH257_04905 [Rhodococcus sp. 05-2256-B3]OZD99577.1 hypothetical protein CH285_20855 [Rhodococcus sp. 05-2256-B1]